MFDSAQTLDINAHIFVKMRGTLPVRKAVGQSRRSEAWCYWPRICIESSDWRWVALGMVCWTAIEYLPHRFVLHGIAPFKRWHEEHHQRPTALIRAPAILRGSVILLLVFFPTLSLGGLWNACL